MRWCFGIGAVHLGTSAQTQVASGYFAVLWQYPLGTLRVLGYYPKYLALAPRKWCRHCSASILSSDTAQSCLMAKLKGLIRMSHKGSDQ